MAHQVGNAIEQAFFGQQDPASAQYAQWENQAYNPQWNINAQGYEGVGYNPVTGTAATGAATLGNYQTGADFGNVLSQAMDASAQFMDPNSAWASGQQAIISEQAGNLAGQTQAQQNQMLAQRGVGGGGLRNILGSQAQAQAGQQARQGATNIATAGAGLGLQALGQAGQLASTQEANALQQALANQAASNQYGLANMSAQNQMSLANMNAQNQAGQFGALAQNQADQWTAGQANQMGQFNVGNQMNWQGWNAGQQFAANQFNASQANAINQQNQANASSGWGTVIGAKVMFMCIPEGTKIDTPNGSVAIEDLKTGDKLIGFNGNETTLQQKHEYKENPEVNRFLEITFDDNTKVNICDMHRINNKRSKDYLVKDKINGKTITDIKWYDGVKTSYDLMTDGKGYRISGLPVNSMIDEIMYMAYKLKEVA